MRSLKSRRIPVVATCLNTSPESQRASRALRFPGWNHGTSRTVDSDVAKYLNRWLKSPRASRALRFPGRNPGTGRAMTGTYRLPAIGCPMIDDSWRARVAVCRSGRRRRARPHPFSIRKPVPCFEIRVQPPLELHNVFARRDVPRLPHVVPACAEGLGSVFLSVRDFQIHIVDPWNGVLRALSKIASQRGR